MVVSWQRIMPRRPVEQTKLSLKGANASSHASDRPTAESMTTRMTHQKERGL
jgi:hypothetical protein